jgi:outer membrane protein TolC
MKFTARAAAAVFFLGIASSATSQSISLSLEQAMDLAADQSFGVRQAQLDRDLAASETAELIRTGLPQISGSVDYTNYIDIPTQVMSGGGFGLDPHLVTFLGGVSDATGVPLNAPAPDPNAITEFQFGAAQTFTAGVTATQLIFSGSFLVGVQAAKAWAKAKESSVGASVQDARRAAAEAYAAVVVGHAQVALFEEMIQVVGNAAKDAQKMAREGLIEPTDADQAELQFSAIQSQMSAATMGVFVAEKVLAFTCALPAGHLIETTDDIRALESSLAGIRTLAIDFRVDRLPTIQSLAHNVELSELGIKIERANGLPTISSFYSNQRNAQRDAFNFMGDGAWYPIQLVGVKVGVPLWSSGSGKEKMAQARIAHEKASLALEQMTLAAELEHHGAMSAYISALDQKQQREKSFTLAMRILDHTGTRFAEGEATSFDFTQATSQALQAQGDYIQAVLASLNAHFRLQHAHGK